MDDDAFVQSLLSMSLEELIAKLAKRGNAKVEVEVESKPKKNLSPLRMKENKRQMDDDDDGSGWSSQDDQQHINSSYS